MWLLLNIFRRFLTKENKIPKFNTEGSTALWEGRGVNSRGGRFYPPSWVGIIYGYRGKNSYRIDQLALSEI